MNPATTLRRSKFDLRFFQLYIVAFPFLNALSPTAWMPLPNTIALLAMIFYAVEGRFWRCFYLERDDALLGGVYLLGIIAIYANLQVAGQKNINYVIWYLLAFTIPLAWSRTWIHFVHATPRDVGAAATIGLMFAALGVIADFVLSNQTGRYLSDYVPFATEDLMQAAVLDNLRRPRGFSAEPGFTAMVMEALAPLSWLYLRDHKKLLYACGTVALVGFLVCFSAAGWLVLFSAGIVLGGIRGKLSKVVLVVLGILAILAFLILSLPEVQWIADQIIGRKLSNLTGNETGAVGDEGMRFGYYRTAYLIFLNHPLGVGWGTISQLYDTKTHLPDVPFSDSRGLLSLYLEVLVSAGLPGLVLLVIYIAKKVGQLARRRDSDSTVILFALLAMTIHHAVVLEFWYPMLWFLIGLSDYLSEAKKVTVEGLNARPQPAE